MPKRSSFRYPLNFILKITGHDVWDNANDLSNTENSFRVRRIALVPGVQYYSNVIAYGFSGIHTTESSDGFKTDNNRPTAGVVYDGIGKTHVHLLLKLCDTLIVDKLFQIQLIL